MFDHYFTINNKKNKITHWIFFSQSHQIRKNIIKFLRPHNLIKATQKWAKYFILENTQGLQRVNIRIKTSFRYISKDFCLLKHLSTPTFVCSGVCPLQHLSAPSFFNSDVGPSSGFRPFLCVAFSIKSPDMIHKNVYFFIYK